jgi:hypothetical protein
MYTRGKEEKVIKKVIKSVEADSYDDEEEEIVVEKKTEKKIEKMQQLQAVGESYSDLLRESSLERMQSKIMNERAKTLIKNVIKSYIPI